MFGTIRKHQTWLWAIIITVIIISFVVFFSPYSKMQDDRRGKVNFGSIHGKKITEQDFINAQREAVLHYFFMSGGRWPDEDARRMGFDAERETFQWLLLVQKANELGLDVNREVAAQAGRDMLAGFRNAGVNSAQAFSKEVLEPRGMSMVDFERFVSHWVAIQEIVATAGTPGRLVTPQEARSIYVRNHEELSADAVFFNASNYLASVAITPEAISGFYSNRLSQYRLPERVQVKYVEFGVSNLLAKAEAELAKSNLTELVNVNFDRLGTNYVRFGKTADEAKAKIREELIRGKALSEARLTAGEFARELFAKEPQRAEDFEPLAKAKGLTIKLSAPFDRQSTPEGMEVGPEFTKAAFSRTADEPFPPPVTGRDGAYVFVVDRRLPSEIPALDRIREKVTADYRMAEAVKLARNAGQAVERTLTNALAQGKSFGDICKDAKVTPIALAPFSISTRTLPQLPDDISLDELKNLAFSTEPGKASKFEETMSGGVIVYVRAKLPIDEAKLQAELPAFTTQLRQSRVNEAFNDWFRKEATTGLRDTPIAQPKPPPTMGPGRASKS